MELTAEAFLAALQARQSDDELRKIARYFKTGDGDYGAGDRFIGVRMGEVFALAKAFIDLPPDEIERLLESDIHEARAGAVSLMAKQAARPSTPQARRGELYGLYLRRHDRINNWDLVDLGARDVVGGWLADKPRAPLYALAASDSLWERRTAIYACLKFIKSGDLDDAYAIGQRLLNDPEDLIQKAVGGVLREAGTKDRDRLLAFLDAHAAAMPRTMLRTMIEHLDDGQRARYRAAGAERTPS